MRTITELNLLLREKADLPGGLKLETETFREGWKIARTVNVQQLDQRVQMLGWNFIRFEDGLQACGVGDTAQDAIHSGLRLALLRLSDLFNAAEVEYIELTQYPWFFLARVRVCPYRIQQDAILPVSDESMPAPILSGQRRLPQDAEVLYPHFGSAIPQLKQMLISSRTTEAGPH
ncbi:MAG: hypothetical protein ABR991_00285 [Terracidiphilus sp.]|jgi:hypothetical protein